MKNSNEFIEGTGIASFPDFWVDLTDEKRRAYAVEQYRKDFAQTGREIPPDHLDNPKVMTTYGKRWDMHAKRQVELVTGKPFPGDNHNAGNRRILIIVVLCVLFIGYKYLF